MSKQEWRLYVRRARAGRGTLVATAEARTNKDNEYPPQCWDEVARSYNRYGYDAWARYAAVMNDDVYVGDVWRSWFLQDLRVAR